MNCYDHPETAAVASCSHGCGRALCPACSEQYDPPSCSVCAAKKASITKQAVLETKSAIIKKIIVNALFLVAYIVPLSHGTGDPNASGLFIIFWIIWGFIGFRWLMEAFHSITGLSIFASLGTWGWMYFIGSVAVAMLGLIVIPILNYCGDNTISATAEASVKALNPNTWVKKGPESVASPRILL